MIIKEKVDIREKFFMNFKEITQCYKVLFGFIFVF